MLNNVNFKKVIFVAGTLFVLCRPAAAVYAYGDDYGHDRDRHGRYYHYHDRPDYGVRIDVVSNDYSRVYAGGAEYYYYDGLFYVFEGRRGYVLVAPPVGIIVSSIPPEYRPVVIHGQTYYTDNGIFYVRVHHGYRVVEPPIVHVAPQTVIVEQPAPAAAETPNKTKVVEGATLGGILGAITGGVIGHQMKGNHDAQGALIGGVAGAAIGGVAGAQVSNEKASTQPASTAQTSVNESVSVNVPNKNGGYTTIVLKRSGSGYIGPQGEYYSEFPKVSQLQAMYSN